MAFSWSTTGDGVVLSSEFNELRSNISTLASHLSVSVSIPASTVGDILERSKINQIYNAIDTLSNNNSCSTYYSSRNSNVDVDRSECADYGTVCSSNNIGGYWGSYRGPNYPSDINHQGNDSN